MELQRYVSFGSYTSAEIAEKLGRQRSAVDARKDKLGIRSIRLSARNPSDVAQILKFRMAGWTQKAIGEVFGVTHSYISDILRQNGFLRFFRQTPKKKRYKNSWTEVELALVRKYLRRGYTTVEIREALPHRSIHAIYRQRSKIKRYYLPKETRERDQRQQRRWVNRTELYIRE